MFVGVTNIPRDYAWGSVGQISALLGREPTTAREAELWLGAHPGSPAIIRDPAQVGGANDLNELIRREGTSILGADLSELPFLLKVLAAAAPLSLQAHPTTEQAIAGFARENSAGIDPAAPDRNYKDSSSKPEIIVAVSDVLEALCGFRPIAQTRATIERLKELDAASASPAPALFDQWLAYARDDSQLRAHFEWLSSAPAPVSDLLARVVELATSAGDEFGLVRRLAQHYPSDPGVLIALMLNHVELARGEALFLDAGNIHAYLNGVGIELMANSDNVLRGGLTPKHVDVPELLSVLDFTAGDPPYLASQAVGHGARVFRPVGTRFQLFEVLRTTELHLPSAAIALCTTGQFELIVNDAVSTVSRGESVFVGGGPHTLSIAGEGQLYLATAQA